MDDHSYQKALQEAQADLEARRQEHCRPESSATAGNTTEAIPPIANLVRKFRSTSMPLLTSSQNLSAPGQTQKPKLPCQGLSKSGKTVYEKHKRPADEICPVHGAQEPRLQLRWSPSGGFRDVWVLRCWAGLDENTQRKAKRAEKVAENRLKKKIQGVGHMEHPGRILRSLTLTRHNTVALGLAKDLVAARYGFLGVHGDASRGKSAIAEAVVSDLVKAGRDALVWQVADLFRHEKASWHEGTASPLLAATKVDVLLLDNMDGLRVGAWNRSELGELLRSRYAGRSRNVTVITSTVDFDELAKMIDLEAITSRFENWGPVVQIGGPPWRNDV